MLSFITVPDEQSKSAYFDVSTQEFPISPHPSIEVRLGDRVGTPIYEVPVNFEAPQVDPSPPPENLSASASINETTFMDIIHVSSD